MAGSFAHLHQHTEYSMLDGAARVKEVVAAAAADGQPALGITDHGNMYGVIEFYRECLKQGINPVIGSEIYMAEESRFSRPKRRNAKHDEQHGGGEGEGERVYYHLTTLAENEVGYRNLIQLSSKAFLDGYYYQPRADWEILADHAKGLIVTTGCLSGHVLHCLKRGDEAAALGYAGRLQDIVGRDNLFVEIQNHGIYDQIRTMEGLIRIAEKLRAPLLATNDSHYVHKHDAKSHDALLCVQTGALLSDEDRFKFDSDEHYLKSAVEMRHVFADYPDACDNTLWVAERAKLDIQFGIAELPVFPIPEGFETDSAYLRHLTFEGAYKRWGTNLPPSIGERLDYELSVIDQMGFSSYFLIVGDLITYARANEIMVGPGRGSAAGCAVAYCLRITDIDPIKYDLLFERFLNPSRVSMPDIDMDFDSRYRDQMIRYAAERYGRDRVAQIITFNTIKARNAVRDAARVLGHPYAVGDQVAKAMPPLIAGRDTPLWAAVADKAPAGFDAGWAAAGPLREMMAQDPDVAEVVDVALGLEGMRRSDGIHASAVVITRDPVTAYAPVQRKPEPGVDPADFPIVTQYEMHAIEDLGLLKMDFLGLRNLDVIDTTVRLLRTRGIEVDVDNLPLDDAATYDLLARGDTVGVFQLEGKAMRDLLRRMAPTCFEDIGAVVALYRPGPMSANMHNDYADRKNGRQPAVPLHPDLEDVLGDTQHLMIYQESMMRVAQRLAGYSLAEADNLRKASGKKVREIMAKERASFVAGCVSQGHPEKLGHDIFDIIEPFADYAFNKSHAFGYGYVTYQTAYLKANYPAEYVASLLTSVKDKTEKAAVFLADARRMGLRVLNPDVNRSISDSGVVATPDDPRGSVLLGLGGIRNVGEGMVAALVQARDAGDFADFYDFCDRVDLGVLNKRSIESLIKAGAFDTLGHSRRGLMFSFEGIVDRAVSNRKTEAAGQFGLFSDDVFDDRPAIDSGEWDTKGRLAFEKEMLGLYVSGHPLADIGGLLSRATTHATADLDELEEDTSITVAGLVTNLERRMTKKGDLMASFDLVDLAGEVSVTVFPRTLKKIGDALADDAVLVVEGRVDKGGPTARDDQVELQVKVAATRIYEFELADAVDAAPVTIGFGNSFTDASVDVLKTVLTRHPGPHPVLVGVDGRTLRLPLEWAVQPSARFAADVAVSLGTSVTVR